MAKSNILPGNFYQRDDVVAIARDLLGKELYTRVNGMLTSGIISETEAYNGIIDRASHAYGGRRTTRTSVMYMEGGTAYVYLCYGIHSLFNVVTNKEDIPHAVLIRSIIPLKGMDIMALRTGKNPGYRGMGKGPGNVSKALGIHFSASGTDLRRKPGKDEDGIWICESGIIPEEEEITVTPRIGVDYAGEDSLLPYRFVYSPK